MSKLLSKITPNFVKREIVDLVTSVRGAKLESLPLTELEERNVENQRTFSNRAIMLQHMKKDAVVAEIGVDSGAFSQQIHTITSPKKLHLIDLWGNERYNEKLKLKVENDFADEISKGSVEINRGMSIEVLAKFSDEYFDWVYIDTDHSYSTTKAELELCALKVKNGGIIAGHDYVTGYWNAGMRFGVVEAVNEFCVNSNWEFLYLTSEVDRHLSFALRKIG